MLGKLYDIKSDVWRYEERYSVGMLIKLLVTQWLAGYELPWKTEVGSEFRLCMMAMVSGLMRA